MKKLSIFLLINIFAFSFGMAQSTEKVEDDSTSTKELLIVETMPEYPGGIERFYEFVTSHLIYPHHVIDEKCYVQFVVEVDGSLSEIKVIKGFNEDLSKELIKVISLGPKWKPATLRKKDVRARVMFPFVFKLK